ncbi:hypothetical protein Bca52824_053425 [Brassica carinata]|uniref:Uncharacterized protein n=1 Tax=Brassica carinata TaxID=52824 RepID=A0A8X7R7Z6_BRACI|nr:hypothetical protein Bca52824_053425 [Brassica carinata]
MMDLQSLDVEPITTKIFPFWPQTSGIKKSSTTSSWSCFSRRRLRERGELRDVVGFLKSLGNYEKSGVLKGAATDSGDAFISVGKNVSFFDSIILISNQGLSHVGFLCVFFLELDEFHFCDV